MARVLGAVASAPTIAAPFSRVNGSADGPYTGATANSFTGWSVDSVSAISDETPFTCVRQGFTTSGAPTTYLDTLYVTRKVRAPAPNTGGATLSPSTYALSEYIWSTDTPSGSVLNNSNLKSPVPIAKWVTPGRYTVGNSIGGSSYPVELIAGHMHARNRQEVACVIFRITDGTTTIPVTVSAPTISSNAYDLTSVTVWALPATDITSLNAGLITVHADVYPWIGDADSILSSEDATNGWEFASQYFRKNVTLNASPLVAYVNTSGNDGTGYVGTDDSLAQGSKFASIKGAVDAADLAFGASSTGIDGLIVYLDNGTHILSAFGTNRRQKISRISVRRSASSTSQSTVTVTSGVTTVQNMNLGTGGSLDTGMAQRRGAIHFYDLTWQRSGAQALVGGNSTYPLELHLERIRLDRNTQTNHLLNGQTVYGFVLGMTFVSSGDNGIGVNTSGVWAVLRGIGTGHANNIESLCLVGSVMTGVGAMVNISPRINNRCVAYNQFLSRNNTWSYAGGDVTGVFNSYNVYEFTGTTSQHSFAVSNDAAAYSNFHVVCHHNTYAGWYIYGRENIHYDEGNRPGDTPSGAAAARASLYMSYVGNIHVSVYHKGDRFNVDNEGNTLNPSDRLGNWSFLYGVGCRHNFQQCMSNGPINVSNQSQCFQGLGTTLGAPGGSGVTWNNTSSTTRLDPKFADDKATRQNTGTTPTAGAGGGTYTLLSDSPAKNAVADPIRPFTLDGQAVGANDNMGALSAA